MPGSGDAAAAQWQSGASGIPKALELAKKARRGSQPSAAKCYSSVANICHSLVDIAGGFAHSSMEVVLVNPFPCHAIVDGSRTGVPLPAAD